MANVARVTQSVIEAVTLTSGTARVTQSVIEFVVGLGVICNSPPRGTVGLAYTHTFLAGSGTTPYSFSITVGSLPPGLSLAAATGIVTGAPTTLGTYTFTVTVTDALGSTSSVACSITIVSQPIFIVLYGWKLYPIEPCDAPTEVESCPPVERAV